MPWGSGQFNWATFGGGPAFGVTDQQLMSLIQLALLEPDDSGATWPSGMWTQAEVVDAINDNQRRFLKETGLTQAVQYLGATAGQARYAFPDDLIDCRRLAFGAVGQSAGSIGMQTALLQGTGAANVAGANTDWLNPTGAIGDDDTTPAAASLLAMALTDLLLVDAYPVATTVPSNATVVGIELVMRRWKVGSASIVDTTIQLAKSGVAVGSNKSTGLTYALTPTDVTFGGTSDLWGATWTVAELATLGVLVGAQNTNAVLLAVANISSMKIRVYFTMPTPTSTTTAYVELARSDGWELDHGDPDWPGESAVPTRYLEGHLPQLQFEASPVPFDVGEFELTYTALGQAADGSGVFLNVPDDWTPAIYYGVLADLLNKQGEAFDPERAAYCESRYEQFVEMARIALGANP